jgi:hypothetical protein
VGKIGIPQKVFYLLFLVIRVSLFLCFHVLLRLSALSAPFKKEDGLCSPTYFYLGTLGTDLCH